MSRIGKKPVIIPAGVKVSLSGTTMKVQGPGGTLTRELSAGVLITVEADRINVDQDPQSDNTAALHGLTRTLIANMVEGVTKGFVRVLDINGVGYRADARGTTLNLLLGFSHPIDYLLPEGVSAEVEKQTKITLKGIDKELVGAVAAKIRSFRSPEPYKGKGIKYAEERIIRKAGKTGKK
ncbi:MAG: 50S ribosomal protein L6 [Desulfuromonadales bacterium]|nr:50S ribosomal protein L6 [Desulfuromonadales bacterium]